MHAHATAGNLAGVRQEFESYERVVTADPWSDGALSPAPLVEASGTGRDRREVQVLVATL